jgi:hypothetical protein
MERISFLSIILFFCDSIACLCSWQLTILLRQSEEILTKSYYKKEKYIYIHKKEYIYSNKNIFLKN